MALDHFDNQDYLWSEASGIGSRAMVDREGNHCIHHRTDEEKGFLSYAYNP